MNKYAALREFHGGFPDSYVVFDCETQGRDPMSPETLIVQLGFCWVVDRQVVDKDAVLLDWTRPDCGVDPVYFKHDLERTKQAMTELGKPYHMDLRTIRAHGIHPFEACEAFVALFEDAKASGAGFCGHNAFMFDRRLIERIFSNIGLNWVFPPNSIVDTGMMQKSIVAGIDIPRQGQQDRDAWYQSVYNARRKGKWSLDSACAGQYNLYARSGLDPSNAHDAGADCVLTHHLLEAMRDLSMESEAVSGQATLV